MQLLIIKRRGAGSQFLLNNYPATTHMPGVGAKAGAPPRPSRSHMCSRNACTVAHTAQPRRWCSALLDSHHGLSTSTATCSIRFRRFADSSCQRRVLTMVEMRCVVKKRGVPTYSFAHREGAACPFSVGFRVGFRTRISLRGMKPALELE